MLKENIYSVISATHSRSFHTINQNIIPCKRISLTKSDHLAIAFASRLGQCRYKYPKHAMYWVVSKISYSCNTDIYLRFEVFIFQWMINHPDV